MEKLTEDVIAEIKRTTTEALNSGISNHYTGMTILLLVEEIERLRAVVAQQAAENAALRDSISRMGDAAFNLRDTVAALNAKPDAAPAPVEIAAAMIGTPDLTDDELEIAKAEMDAFYGRTEDDEPDYEAYRAAQEKAHWDMLDQMEDERELDEYFEEHGVEPGGTCPNCGRTDAGCTCDQYDGFDNPYTSRFQEYEPPSDW